MCSSRDSFFLQVIIRVDIERHVRIHRLLDFWIWIIDTNSFNQFINRLSQVNVKELPHYTILV